MAVYVQEQLLLRKGVRIPTFGSFTIVSERIEAEDGAMTLQWPAFCLARNLAGIHNLMESDPAGHKEVQPLKYTEVAAAASVTWQTGKACIFGTTSLVSHCLRKGENIAFVLKDIGVLLIEGTRVQMKFYYDFLERISGKENLEKVVFKVPRLRDMVVSRVAAVASLTSCGRVIVFPRFRREFVPKPPPRTARKACHVPLPPLDQGKKEELPELPPLPSWIRVTFLVEKQPEKETSDVKKKASQLPVVPGASSAKKQPQKKKEGKMLCQKQGGRDGSSRGSATSKWQRRRTRRGESPRWRRSAAKGTGQAQKAPWSPSPATNTTGSPMVLEL